MSGFAVNTKSILSAFGLSRPAVFGACAALMAASGLPGSAANAAVLYSNFGPGNSYACCIGSGVFGGIFGSGVDAMPFTPTAAGDVGQIDLALNTFIGTSGGVTISLWTNNGGALGTQLGSWSANPPGSGLLTIGGISGVHLDALTSYFLAATEAGDAIDIWYDNNTGAFGTIIIAGSPQNNFLKAFDVLSANVTTPVPAALPLFATGLGAMALLARRRKRKSAAPAAAV
jgi:hypothetical protein